jgi:hypothetical protein
VWASDAEAINCPVKQQALEAGLIHADTDDSTARNDDHWAVMVNRAGVVRAASCSQVPAATRSRRSAGRFAAAKVFTASTGVRWRAIWHQRRPDEAPETAGSISSFVNPVILTAENGRPHEASAAVPAKSSIESWRRSCPLMRHGPAQTNPRGSTACRRQTTKRCRSAGLPAGWASRYRLVAATGRRAGR